MPIIPISWTPFVGPETEEFLTNSVPADARAELESSGVSILSKCVSPERERGQETGLVIGYVQSGKTMSFETVTALARDNGFQIVIVVAGVANPLLNQSSGRLQNDLQINNPNKGRRWVQFTNPSNEEASKQAIQNVLADWQDVETPDDYKKTILITVLKHHKRINSLRELLSTLHLSGVPVLIIDDEADQASLNTEVGQGQESTTYSRIMSLRQVLPNHTYLQYTATPQAPLLVNIIDSLSPNFVHVLRPGSNYVGGMDFFLGNQNYVRVIPPNEVPTNANQLTEPPPSLVDALRFFMVGVAVGLQLSNNRGNRSMLVHPSHLTAQHQEFYNWVRNIFEEWKRILNLPESDPDRIELIQDFYKSYGELIEATDEPILSFEEVQRNFRFAFRHTQVREINARGGKTPTVNWLDSYGWILVGGQAMDRGFTVEGLTVTYMPRGVGTGNADTIQQRARFFGYKRSYLGYCRIYLERGTLHAFQSYVEHEEDIRGQLQNFQNDNKPLNEWKRTFILDASMQPCRDSVLDFDYIRGRYSNSWFNPSIVLAADDLIESNRATINKFTSSIKFSPDTGHADRTETQKHAISENVPLRSALADLLVPIRTPGTTDSQKYTGLLLQLSKALSANPDEVCTIYKISPAVRRRRGIGDDGEITNIFQGAFPVEELKRGSIYPGDRAIRDVNNVTIQIHRLDLFNNDIPSKSDVPIITVWVPSRLEKTWISQQ